MSSNFSITPNPQPTCTTTAASSTTSYLMSPGRVRKPRAVQAKTADQDVDYHTRMSCSVCQIWYYTPAGYAPKCPLCDAEKQIAALRSQIYEAEQRVIRANAQTEQVQMHVDIVLAMRQALDITSETDLTFLKSVLYRWRHHKAGVQLKILHAAPQGQGRGRRKALPPNGFIGVFQHGEPEAHECTSMGGLALAGYFIEAMQLAGSARAMDQLHKALSTRMAPPP